jgi:hypothetical protein
VRLESGQPLAPPRLHLGKAVGVGEPLVGEEILLFASPAASKPTTTRDDPSSP